MSTESHKSCYGKMFPSIQSLRATEPIRGKVFSALPGSPPGTVVSKRRVQVAMEQWDDCLACAEFEHCRKLAHAKLSLESAVSRYG